MTDTRHLDNAIAIFKGKPSAKRAPKTNVFHVVCMGGDVYCIQLNGRVLENVTGKENAILLAQSRAARASATTGKNYTYTLME